MSHTHFLSVLQNIDETTFYPSLSLLREPPTHSLTIILAVSLKAYAMTH